MAKRKPANGLRDDKKLPEKRGPGRPPAADPQSARFIVRATQGESAAVEKAAKKEGVSVSAWIRAAILARLGRG